MRPRPTSTNIADPSHETSCCACPRFLADRTDGDYRRRFDPAGRRRTQLAHVHAAERRYFRGERSHQRSAAGAQHGGNDTVAGGDLPPHYLYNHRGLWYREYVREWL